MMFFNEQDYDNWNFMTGLMIITTTILLFCSGCSHKINNPVTSEIIDKIVVPEIVDKVKDKIVEDAPMKISFSDDVIMQRLIYTVGTWAEDKDCLWNISIIAYGNPDGWMAIYKANRDIIQGPDLIYPGQRLYIP